MQFTKETLFKPTRAETKLSATDSAARSIVEKETEAREAKTRRLRELRLEKEAEVGEEDTAPKKKPRKAAKPRSRASA